MKKKFYIVTIIVSLLITVGNPLYADSQYNLKVVSALVAERKADGRHWDVYPQAPDPFVKVFIGGDLLLQTSVQQDTYTPNWQEKKNISYKKGLSIRIEVWDRDQLSNDLIGIWSANELPDKKLSFGQLKEFIIFFE